MLRRALNSLLLAVAAACGAQPPETLVIATTTSVQNSGLLDVLLPAYREATIRVHATGSGRALQMLADGAAAFAISHAPLMELQFLAEHHGWQYQKIAYNQFVIVGPAADPAGIRAAPDAVTAFRQIAASRSFFVSRGDQSGTHEREQTFWQAANIVPGEWLLISGRGMAQALRHADEKQGYTLSDQATFWQLESDISLITLFDKDPRLINTYAMVYRNSDPQSASFARWLNGAGRQIIEGFLVRGRRAFATWPPDCPSNTPEATPCQERPR